MIARLSEKDKKKVSYFESQISGVNQSLQALDANVSKERDRILKEFSKNLDLKSSYDLMLSDLFDQNLRIRRAFNQEIAEAERQIDAIHKSSYLLNFKVGE